MMVQEGGSPFHPLAPVCVEHLQCVRFHAKVDTLTVIIIEGQVGRGQQQGVKGQVTCSYVVILFICAHRNL